MLNFLFWNIAGKDLTDSLIRLVDRHHIDILMLAECPIRPGNLLTKLNATATHFHYSPGIICKRIEVFTRFPGQFLRPAQESERISIRRLTLPGPDEILVVLVHMQSKLHQSEASQAAQCRVLSLEIRTAESQVGHQRTVLVGDLNMNPFEPGVVSAEGLHAVMARSVVVKGSRTVGGAAYPYFYNPMWQHFGDADERPPGTFYYQRAEHINYFWNMFDQVLIRPELLNAFQNNSLEILGTDGQIQLTRSDGTPDKSTSSDHLPLLFRLNL